MGRVVQKKEVVEYSVAYPCGGVLFKNSNMGLWELIYTNRKTFTLRCWVKTIENIMSPAGLLMLERKEYRERAKSRGTDTTLGGMAVGEKVKTILTPSVLPTNASSTLK